tara:strand:- start:741 stop:1310 length:570 start_codon:yes stop_codon:yes gene_type:complete
MQKKSLSETFLNQHFLSEKSLVQQEHLIEVAEKCNEKLSNNNFDYQRDYNKLIDDQQIFWLLEYIIDIYDLNYDTPLIFLKSAVIKLKPGHNLNSHNHLDEYDIDNSPDITCLYCVKVKDVNVDDWSKNSVCMVEYEDHRWKQKKWEVPIERKKFILFNSSLNHSIINKESEDMILLSFQFQTLGTATK